ncbi:hypothetical protein LOB69_01270 [Lactobacillus delbrueckii subsp. lactis]|nr:hypothetical protein [Lactobacillus delbrueckii]MCD5542223.1 hypothetical protein [Lactobacillus delbrueckii subsp. lactis]
MVDFIMRQLGIHAIISLVIYFVCIALAFQAIKAVRIEKIGSLSNLTDACQEILHMFDEGTKQNTSV